MVLVITILNGSRKGQAITLSHNQSTLDTIEWIKEDESVEFSLTTSDEYESAVLELYEHSIPSTTIRRAEDNQITFIWSPAYREPYGYEKVFINYFGIAEFNVALKKKHSQDIHIDYFKPIEVLASKLNSDRVSEMLTYISNTPGELIHSIFRTTRHGAKLGDGSSSPSLSLERIESLIDKFKCDLQLIFRHPITRLIPEHKIINPTGQEDIDDSSMGWLLSNMSVLSATDSAHDAHFEHNKDYFKATLIQLPILTENTDLYENKVLHGFVLQLTQEVNSYMRQYTSFNSPNRISYSTKPIGYSSFFDQMTTFKNILISEQIKRCNKLADSLKQIKIYLESKIPVKHAILERPIVTHKVRHNHAYRSAFIKMVEWHEKGKPDWSAYENLFAIQSIPTIFEVYSYLRTLLHLNKTFPISDVSLETNNELVTQFIDNKGTDIWLRREPIYWMSGHPNSVGETFVNTEGWNHSKHKPLKKRSTNGLFSHRKPDISIEIKNKNDHANLIVLDAKYTTPERAFRIYLPELTMKYVHGLHQVGSDHAVVSSLTIIHPSDEKIFRSFHNQMYDIYGEHPVSPSLQCIGISSNNVNSTTDGYEYLLDKILSLNGVDIGNININTKTAIV
ncbi:DUF2357 domain-containing protein [Aeromonas hydrophila]|uniref:DUF2357 domain-containing protein n=1 Tax=Aeromonas hydrophila TaxID=644 RepID=UPI002B49446A|nr:DUF2357 domain-containing protein [Aeromonas hydrophila]